MSNTEGKSIELVLINGVYSDPSRYVFEPNLGCYVSIDDGEQISETYRLYEELKLGENS